MNTLFTDNWFFKEFPLNTEFSTMNASTELYSVDIPHDWMIWHTKDLYKNCIGFYRKNFTVSLLENHTYIVRFEGVYMDTRIYLNGAEIFEWKYGYSTFDVDLTGLLKDGENTLCVSCTYQAPNSRWYSGAGIYRNVYFIDKNDTYIANDGIYISTSKEAENFKVSIDTEICSKFNKAAKVTHTVLNHEGDIVLTHSETIDTIMDSKVTNTCEFTVPSPRLWDIKDPYLYSVNTTLTVDDSDEVKDTVTSPLGFRTIAFDADKGFFLNGRNVKINGACQHHDLGALGSAMNKTALKRQFVKLMEMGVNSIRTSHNMPARELFELADELGMLIYTESFDMWELPKTEFDYGNYFPDWWEKDVISWVKRDINHPSLIIWGIGNEIYDTHGGNGLKWTKLLRDKVRELDYRHNAYIGIGSNYIEWENAQKCSDLLELSGYNYGERLYDAHHKKYPHWCIFGSETSSTVQSRGIYHFPYENRLLTFEDAQCSCLGNCTTNWGARDTDIVVTEHRDREFVFGQYIWTGWDYIGEPTPYFSKNSFFGQIDTAGFEKDTFYHYQAEWTDCKTNPMVHLLPYWDYNEGQIIDVCAYSNAPYVELYFNGQSQGKQHIDHEHGLFLQGHWKLPYSKGELKVIATDEDGNVIATDIQKSFTDPVKILLEADKTSFNASEDDLIFVSVSTVDKDGTFVANAKNRINFSVSGAGRLVGLDNGDSTDYEEYKGTSRRLFSGRLLAIIARTKEAGDITVYASSDGLATATLTLNSPDSVDSSSSMSIKNFESLEQHDIPVRKIELINTGSNSFNPDCTETKVQFKIYPENATYKDITVKALTNDAVEANFVKVTVDGEIATVKALGDGDFRLTATCNNDKDHAEIISELEFSVTGLGLATQDPYGFVPGCQFSSASSDETKLSFQGGVFLPTQGTSYVTYDNVDFGEFGSDTVTLPIFSFHDSFDVEVWEGSYQTGDFLGRFTYTAKSWYNHYQENTFTLSRRISGTTSVTFVFHIDDRISLKGFSFAKPEKAYSKIYAIENSRITGDSFNVLDDVITNIGNNVSVDFDNMDFSHGVNNITICGRSHNEKTSMHILFIEGQNTERQMVEIPYSEDYTEITLPLNSVTAKCTVSLVFLPGSNFDLKYFKFS